MIKKSILLFALLAFIFSACNKSVAPKEVTAKFAEKYAEVKEVNWVKLDDGNFEATFTMEEKEWKALFAPDGTWLKSYMVVDEADFPAGALEYVKVFYTDLSYRKEVTEEGEVFKALWMKADSTEAFATFDADGKLLADENNAILAAFNQKYAGMVAKWAKTDAGYTATFDKEGQAYVAEFAADGSWTQTTAIVPAEKVGNAMLDFIKKKCKLCEIKEAKMIENATATTYEVKAALKDVEQVFVFDKDGKFLEMKK